MSNPKFTCTFCENENPPDLEAHHTGEGWALFEECSNCGDIEEITEWPWPGREVNAKELRAMGYEIV